MKCRFCNKEFIRPCGLAIHERTCKQNPDRRPVENHVCNFPKEGKYLPKEGGWECSGCGDKLRTRKELSEHHKHCTLYSNIERKHPKKEFVCSFCNKTFLTTKEGVKQHENYCIKNTNRILVNKNIDLSSYDKRTETSIALSDYYKSRGAKSIRLYYCEDGRKRVNIYFEDHKVLWISYAKYLWISNYGEIPDGYEVDHINENRTDDRLENLQLLPSLENKRKYASLHKKVMVECVCPVCGKQFPYEKRNLSTHPNPCCSRKCGGIKSHWKD